MIASLAYRAAPLACPYDPKYRTNRTKRQAQNEKKSNQGNLPGGGHAAARRLWIDPRSARIAASY